MLFRSYKIDLKGVKGKEVNEHSVFDGAYKDYEIGHKYLIKGSIKAHEEYRGVKQTVITRCKVVDDFIERNIEVVTNKANHEYYKIEEADPFEITTTEDVMGVFEIA